LLFASELTKLVPMATRQTEPLRLSANCIAQGRFIPRGEPVPFTHETLPEHLRPYVAAHEAAEELDDSPRGSFELNVAYAVTSDNRLGRQVRREMRRIEEETEAELLIEEEAANVQLPEEIASELADEHAQHVARQVAQLGASARMSDAIADAAAEASAPPRLYVKRGGRHYASVDRAKLKPDEAVYVRQPDGHFEYVGQTDSRGEPPDAPVTL
jgi:hypothetical protein